MRTQDLLTTEYYVSKLSLAMQNDQLVLVKVKSACTLLRNIDSSIDSFKSALNELMNILINTDDAITSYTYTDLLDKIAACFGINRKFVIDFKDPQTNIVDSTLKASFDNFNDPDDGPAHGQMCTRICLTNNQLRAVLFCAIMKNSYDGSYEMLRKTYDTLFGRLIKADITSIDTNDWTIYQVTREAGAAQTLFAYGSLPQDNTTNDWVDGNSQTGYLTSNWNYFSLFFANMLTVQSAGIYYFVNATNLSSTFKWAAGYASTYEHPTEENKSTCWDFYNADTTATSGDTMYWL